MQNLFFLLNKSNLFENKNLKEIIFFFQIPTLRRVSLMWPSPCFSNYKPTKTHSLISYDKIIDITNIPLLQYQ